VDGVIGIKMENLWKIIRGIKRIEAGGVIALASNRYLVEACERAVKLAVDVLVEVLAELAKRMGWEVPEDRRELIQLFKRRGVLNPKHAEEFLRVLSFAEVVERTELEPVDRFEFIEPREIYMGIRILRQGLEEVAQGVWRFAEVNRVVMRGTSVHEIEQSVWRELALAEA